MGINSVDEREDGLVDSTVTDGSQRTSSGCCVFDLKPTHAQPTHYAIVARVVAVGNVLRKTEG